MIWDSIFQQQASVRSHWHESIPPLAGDSNAAIPARVKHLVVGAGITGAALVHDLVHRGEDPAAVLLIDGAFCAAGASGRNAGFVLTFPGTILLDWIDRHGEEFTHAVMEQNLRNQQLVRETATRGKLWTQRAGSYHIAGSEREFAEIIQCAEFLRNRLGIGELIARDASPIPVGHGSLRMESDFGINPVEYANHLVAGSRVRFIGGCAAHAFSASSAGVEVTANRGTIHCERLYLAVNVSIRCFREWIQSTVPIVPQRNQVLLVRRNDGVSGFPWGDALYYANEGYDYWRQLPDGRILIGGARNHDFAGEETTELAANPRVLDALEREIVPRITGGPFTVEMQWSGIMAFTGDELPVCGILPGTDGRIIYATGYSGYGLGLHRAVAGDMNALSFGDATSSLFSPDRFTKRPITAHR